MAKPKPATEAEARDAAAALLRFWEAGRGSWGRVDPDKPAVRRKTDATAESDYKYGNKLDLLQAEADRLGMNPDTLKKAWKVGREYTREQIELFGGLVVKHRARFGPTHLTRLLAVSHRKGRDALARAAIRERWGVSRLERAIQAGKGGRRPRVGKKPAIPDTEPELLVALTLLCDKWGRWVAAAGAQIPDDLRGVVDRATAAVAKVRNAVAAKLSEVE
jgi:hypothetical protein